MDDDDLDIYGDLVEFQQVEERKSKELAAWEEKYNEALKDNDALRLENKELLKKVKRIEVNFQNLLDTAKAEVKRQEKLIADLRKEKDDICFRRKRPKLDDSYAISQQNVTFEATPKGTDKSVALPDAPVVPVEEPHKSSYTKFENNKPINNTKTVTNGSKAKSEDTQRWHEREHRFRHSRHDDDASRNRHHHNDKRDKSVDYKREAKPHRGEDSRDRRNRDSIDERRDESCKPDQQNQRRLANKLERRHRESNHKRGGERSHIDSDNTCRKERHRKNIDEPKRTKVNTTELSKSANSKDLHRLEKIAAALKEQILDETTTAVCKTGEGKAEVGQGRVVTESKAHKLTASMDENQFEVTIKEPLSSAAKISADKSRPKAVLRTSVEDSQVIAETDIAELPEKCTSITLNTDVNSNTITTNASASKSATELSLSTLKKVALFNELFGKPNNSNICGKKSVSDSDLLKNVLHLLHNDSDESAHILTKDELKQKAEAVTSSCVKQSIDPNDDCTIDINDDDENNVECSIIPGLDLVNTSQSLIRKLESHDGCESHAEMSMDIENDTNIMSVDDDDKSAARDVKVIETKRKGVDEVKVGYTKLLVEDRKVVSNEDNINEVEINRSLIKPLKNELKIKNDIAKEYSEKRKNDTIKGTHIEPEAHDSKCDDLKNISKYVVSKKSTKQKVDKVLLITTVDESELFTQHTSPSTKPITEQSKFATFKEVSTKAADSNSLGNNIDIPLCPEVESKNEQSSKNSTEADCTNDDKTKAPEKVFNSSKFDSICITTKEQIVTEEVITKVEVAKTREVTTKDKEAKLQVLHTFNPDSITIVAKEDVAIEEEVDTEREVSRRASNKDAITNVKGAKTDVPLRVVDASKCDLKLLTKEVATFEVAIDGKVASRNKIATREEVTTGDEVASGKNVISKEVDINIQTSERVFVTAKFEPILVATKKVVATERESAPSEAIAADRGIEERKEVTTEEDHTTKGRDALREGVVTERKVDPRKEIVTEREAAPKKEVERKVDPRKEEKEGIKKVEVTTAEKFALREEYAPREKIAIKKKNFTTTKVSTREDTITKDEAAKTQASIRLIDTSKTDSILVNTKEVVLIEEEVATELEVTSKEALAKRKLNEKGNIKKQELLIQSELLKENIAVGEPIVYKSSPKREETVQFFQSVVHGAAGYKMTKALSKSLESISDEITQEVSSISPTLFDETKSVTFMTSTLINEESDKGTVESHLKKSFDLTVRDNLKKSEVRVKSEQSRAINDAVMLLEMANTNQTTAEKAHIEIIEDFRLPQKFALNEIPLNTQTSRSVEIESVVKDNRNDVQITPGDDENVIKKSEDPVSSTKESTRYINFVDDRKKPTENSMTKPQSMTMDLNDLESIPEISSDAIELALRALHDSVPLSPKKRYTRHAQQQSGSTTTNQAQEQDDLLDILSGNTKSADTTPIVETLEDGVSFVCKLTKYKSNLSNPNIGEVETILLNRAVQEQNVFETTNLKLSESNTHHLSRLTQPSKTVSEIVAELHSVRVAVPEKGKVKNMQEKVAQVSDGLNLGGSFEINLNWKKFKIPKIKRTQDEATETNCLNEEQNADRKKSNSSWIDPSRDHNKKNKVANSEASEHRLGKTIDVKKYNDLLLEILPTKKSFDIQDELEIVDSSSEKSTQTKRGRGRPRKHPIMLERLPFKEKGKPGRKKRQPVEDERKDVSGESANSDVNDFSNSFSMAADNQMTTLEPEHDFNNSVLEIKELKTVVLEKGFQTIFSKQKQENHVLPNSVTESVQSRTCLNHTMLESTNAELSKSSPCQSSPLYIPEAKRACFRSMSPVELVVGGNQEQQPTFEVSSVDVNVSASMTVKATIDETIAREIEDSPSTTTQLSNDSNVSTNNGSIVTKRVSMGSTDYRFEQMPNNQIKLVVTRRGRKRKAAELIKKTPTATPTTTEPVTEMTTIVAVTPSVAAAPTLPMIIGVTP